MLDKAMESLAVIGAAGKMGRGIALLLLQNMPHTAQSKLVLFDLHQKGLKDLEVYLRGLYARYLEKHLDLVDDDEARIPYYVDKAMEKVTFSNQINSLKDARLVFEAVLEDLNLKVDIYSQLSKLCSKDCFFLSNTSSIPLHLLDEQAGLDHRIVGFHFYNPPPIQKLVEIIIPKNCDKRLVKLSKELGKKLKKTLIHSNDIAGFIGNGHFIRDILSSCRRTRELESDMPLSSAIALMNHVTQDFMLRPMGIYQLIDYVGIDVVQKICDVMDKYIDGTPFQEPLLKKMLALGIVGGQDVNGMQKDGFLSYDGRRPTGVLDISCKGYAPLPELEKYGQLPKGHETWRDLARDPDKEGKMKLYFQNLEKTENLASELAREQMKHSFVISEKLVSDKVAKSLKDVNRVLKNGFGHIYDVEVDLAKALKS